MTEPIKDGGPAFPMASGPEPRANETTHYNEGMTLRDYFAAKAMQGMLANKGFIYGKTADEDDSNGAKRAYKIADAMMKAREQRD